MPGTEMTWITPQLVFGVLGVLVVLTIVSLVAKGR